MLQDISRDEGLIHARVFVGLEVYQNVVGKGILGRWAIHNTLAPGINRMQDIRTFTQTLNHLE